MCAVAGQSCRIWLISESLFFQVQSSQMLGRLVMQGSAVPDSRQLRKSHTTQLKIRSFFFFPNEGENPIGRLLGNKATNNVLELCIYSSPPPPKK